jgi:hypothetical protein
MAGPNSGPDRPTTTSGSSTICPKTSPRAIHVAQDNPAKLKEMQDLFMSEAEKFQVFPLDDTYLERLPPANRPQHNVGRTS